MAAQRVFDESLQTAHALYVLKKKKQNNNAQVHIITTGCAGMCERRHNKDMQQSVNIDDIEMCLYVCVCVYVWCTLNIPMEF